MANQNSEKRAPSLLGCLPGLTTHCLPQNSEKNQRNYGVTNGDDTLPPVPTIEIFPSDVVKSKPFAAEPINLEGGLTLLKGRVNVADVFGTGTADLIPGKYEGGLKLWECAIDLLNTLRQEIQDGHLSFRGKRVLELGCGHGLPGIFACLKGASLVHFQDFNVEVLRSLTIPNVNSNLEHARARQSCMSDGGQMSKSNFLSPDVHYYSGDWAEMEKVLSVVDHCHFELADVRDCREPNSDDGTLGQDDLGRDSIDKNSNNYGIGNSVKRARKLSGSQACERGNGSDAQEDGYDIILMSETVYSLASLPRLYDLIKKCLRSRYGVVYLAGKKHYFGVGGGTRQFKHIVEEDGILGAHLVADFSDGSSNVREIWKFFSR
eukprot:c25817_g1_i5 orf=290-1420(-)